MDEHREEGRVEFGLSTIKQNAFWKKEVGWCHHVEMMGLKSRKGHFWGSGVRCLRLCPEALFVAEIVRLAAAIFM